MITLIRKAIIKHANRKALRRQNREAVLELDDQPVVERPARREWKPEDIKYVLIPFVVMMWDDGLDYDMEGNSYFDDYPDYHEHSYHHTRKDAEVEVAYIEQMWEDLKILHPKSDIVIRENCWVPDYDSRLAGFNG